MARTLSNGFTILEQDDSAEVFFNATNNNILLMNQVAQIERSGQGADVLALTINAADWEVDPSGGYQKQVAWTSALNGQNANFNIFKLPNYERMFLDYTVEEKNITVYINDNSVAVKIHGISL